MWMCFIQCIQICQFHKTTRSVARIAIAFYTNFMLYMCSCNNYELLNYAYFHIFLRSWYFALVILIISLNTIIPLSRIQLVFVNINTVSLVFTDIYIKLNVVFICTYNFRTNALNFLLFEIHAIYKIFVIN